MQSEVQESFQLVLSEFLNSNLDGDSFVCLDWLNDKLKFLVMKMNQKQTSGLTIDLSDENFKRKVSSVPKSSELVASIKLTLENNLYIYNGSLEFLNTVVTEFTKRLDQLKENLERTMRMPLLGPKSLNRAFYPFEGSYRYMVGFIESQGSRPTMEDEIVVFGMGPRMRKNEDYFAVFDGHGGTEASAFAAKHLHEYLDENLCNHPDYFIDSSLISDENIISAFKNTFRQLDTAMCVQYGMQAGACALVTYFSGNRIFTANLGDSRAVMGTKHGTVKITHDHKPMNPDEYDRITSLEGGFISTDNLPARVQGQLSVSRALGDRHLKPFVSGEPDVYCTHLTDDHYFIILGCDGVWDKITNETAVEVTLKSNNPQEAASNIFKKLKGKSDNISIVVIFLKPPHAWKFKTVTNLFEPQTPQNPSSQTVI